MNGKVSLILLAFAGYVLAGGADEGEHSECGAVEETSTDAIHIASVFIVLVASIIGASLPLIFRSYRKTSDGVFDICKAFGYGVILCVGFVHLLPEANESLTSSCLGSFADYGLYSGVFSIAAVLSMQLIQTIAINHMRRKAAPETIDQKDVEEGPGLEAASANLAADGCCATPVKLLQDHERHNKTIAYLLEFGVIIHSVIVGLTLGVSDGPQFTALLIAIVFHQLFEGFALSATYLDSGFKTLRMPLLMSGLYAVAAPIGVSIGLAVRSTYSGSSVEALLVSGVLNAVSAGILIYDVLVNLITPGITHSHKFTEASFLHKLLTIGALWIGCAFMAIVGIWA